MDAWMLQTTVSNGSNSAVELGYQHLRARSHLPGDRRMHPSDNNQWVPRVLRTLAALAVKEADCEGRGHACAVLSPGFGTSPTSNVI
jgi:hypothetical protein